MSSPEQALQSDKERYFQQLFNSYWKQVYNICYSYTNDTGVSKDLTQNIFLSLWERNFLPEDQKEIEKYLSAAAKYQVLNHFRKEKRIQLKETFSEQYIDDNNPYNDFHKKEMLQVIQKYIDSLNEPAKTIFKLSREEEMTYKEISAKMGLSVKTVEFHISKVLKQLRKLFSVIKM